LCHQRLAQLVVDGAQTRHPHAGAELVEQRHVRYALPPPQASEGSPRALLREHRQEQIQRPDWGQNDQQMQPPQLGGTEGRTRATRRTEIPPLVDERIRNVRIQQVQQPVGAGLG